MSFSLHQQIEEVEREIKLRKEVYPRLVINAKMRQSIADFHLARMEAVLATLCRLAEAPEPEGAAPWDKNAD